jgi:hypothetical protein
MSLSPGPGQLHNRKARSHEHVVSSIRASTDLIDQKKRASRRGKNTQKAIMFINNLCSLISKLNADPANAQLTPTGFFATRYWAARDITLCHRARIHPNIDH